MQAYFDSHIKKFLEQLSLNPFSLCVKPNQCYALGTTPYNEFLATFVAAFQQSFLDSNGEWGHYCVRGTCL